MESNDLKKVSGILLVVVTVVTLSFSVFSKAEKEHMRTTGISYQQSAIISQQSGHSSQQTAGNYPDFTDAAAKTVQAVVHIRCSYTQKSNYYDQYYENNPFFEYFFGQPQRQREEEVQQFGSGVIISSDGFIVTNNHVVQDADSIEITLNDKRVFTAKLIGNDPNSDIAVVKIEATNLPFLTYGNSDELKVGEWVLAVGNPYNLTSTVTAGIVSAKARDINILGGENTIRSFIQTDAPVNPGNSGGALVNTNGELVGINAAIASNTGSFTGYAFAIPVNIAMKVVDDIMKYGMVQRAMLGIRMQEITPKLAEKMGITNLQGVYVNSIVPNSGAEEAGIKQGDVLTKLGGLSVNSIAQVTEVMGEHRPGDKVDAEILREGKPVEVTVMLKNDEGNTNIVKKDENTTALGGDFELASREEMRRLGIDHGIRVKKLSDGKLKKAGIKAGFIITAIDHQAVTSVQELKRALGSKNNGLLIEGVYPNGLRYFYGFGM